MSDILRTWARRLASVTLYASLALLAMLGLPVLLGLAAAVDAVRGGNRWATLRGLAFVLWYLLCELAGVVACAALWMWRQTLRLRADDARGALPGSAAHVLTSLPAAYLRANFHLQCWWARTLLAGASWIFGMRITVDGDDAVRRGPFLLMLRHASIGDTLLPAVCIASRHGILLRYIMKRELLWDPCLDIVGNRLPNCFVRRGSGDSEREVRAVQRLMEHLGPADGVLIYPEGTRFSAAKQRRALARLEGAASPRLLAQARALRFVLPPRLGGTLGLLAKNPGVDVVFCAHLGFEGAASFGDLLAGSLIDRQVRVRFWRVPFSTIPRDAAAQADWLYEHWLRIDDWLAEQRGETHEDLDKINKIGRTN